MNLQNPKSVKSGKPKPSVFNNDKLDNCSTHWHKTGEMLPPPLSPGNEIPAKHPSETDTMKINHGLEASAIELSITNDKQILAQNQTDAGLDKYFGFYNSAPAGYYVISRKGEILELNLAGAQILGYDPEHLKNSRFDLFISEDTKPAFSHFLDQVFKNKTKTIILPEIRTTG
jgi:PAS domain-containing protein